MDIFILSIKKAFTYRSHKKAIMDYDKTYQAYKDLGMGKKFENLPDYSLYKFFNDLLMIHKKE